MDANIAITILDRGRISTEQEICERGESLLKNAGEENVPAPHELDGDKKRAERACNESVRKTSREAHRADHKSSKECKEDFDQGRIGLWMVGDIFKLSRSLRGRNLIMDHGTVYRMRALELSQRETLRALNKMLSGRQSAIRIGKDQNDDRVEKHKVSLE